MLKRTVNSEVVIQRIEKHLDVCEASKYPGVEIPTCNLRQMVVYVLQVI